MAKWTSSNEQIRKELKLNSESVDLTKNENLKALGLGWNPIQDEQYYKIVQFEENTKLTKRVLLSNISRLFDPIGYLSPLTIVSKLMMKEALASKIT